MARDIIDVAAVQAALSDRKGRWTAAENDLTKLTGKQRRHRLGVPLPDAKQRAALEKAARGVGPESVQNKGLGAAASTLPAAFDLRDVGGQNYVSGIRDQGNCGSCVAFGCVATMEGTARYGARVPTLDVDLSEAHLFYGWGGTVGVTCDTGWMPLPALTYCTQDGICYESDWPYTAGNTNGGSAPSGWQAHSAQATGTLDVTHDVTAIKTHLTTTGPVACSFIVYDDFFSYSSGVYHHVSGAEAGGHCVAIVGYDDTQQAWIIKNQWGTGWGMDGWGYIGYGECLIETWSDIAVTGVRLRTWTTPKHVIGAYGTGDDRNGWVYLQDTGWLRVGGSTATAHVAMFGDLLTAKEEGAYVNVYDDQGSITTAYAY